MAKMIDLSELVEAVTFGFNDQEFDIPPIPDDKLKGLMGMANKISASKNPADSTDDPDEPDDGLTEEEREKKHTEEFINDQNSFLAMAVRKKEGKEGDETYKNMKKNDFITWPLKLKNRVMELVFEQIGTSSGDKVSKEAEKN